MDNQTTILKAVKAESINRYATNLQQNTQIGYADLWEAIEALTDAGMITFDPAGPGHLTLTPAGQWTVARI